MTMDNLFLLLVKATVLCFFRLTNRGFEARNNVKNLFFQILDWSGFFLIFSPWWVVQRHVILIYFSPWQVVQRHVILIQLRDNNLTVLFLLSYHILNLYDVTFVFHRCITVIFYKELVSMPLFSQLLSDFPLYPELGRY